MTPPYVGTAVHTQAPMVPELSDVRYVAVINAEPSFAHVLNSRLHPHCSDAYII
jgi:hypothetical protein